MADIKEAFKLLMKLEFGSASTALEKNATESGYTFMGIYYTAHPDWSGWDMVKQVVSACSDLRTASSKLYHDPDMQEMVYSFYKEEFWDLAHLDDVSQIQANCIFTFGVNAGMKTGIIAAQRVVGVPDDGQIGPMTMRALQAFDDDIFNMKFNTIIKSYYDHIMNVNPAKSIYIKGWYNRADIVRDYNQNY